MTYRNVAFIGKAQSGKDTAGKRLVDNWAFTRLAFADPLKRMALQINPYVPTGYGVTVRLETLIADVGWEYAKDRYPEVRRILQHTGQTVREQDEDFWVRVLMQKVRAADGWNMPVVVTDCRYENEALTLRAHGFILVRIKRPDLVSTDRHDSENALNDFPADETLINGGSVFDLHTLTDALVSPR
ncbi:deoxynucleotide monophosphate kinase family protein [Streptomyces sp. IBSBF 3010]|uniref:deoxynucleotide monophosphate kinase family protein n=1 Tax=Streptomyces sp. IBSBF 3010 TaxID=2903526 RepID=UPI002FDBAA3B